MIFGVTQKYELRVSFNVLDIRCDGRNNTKEQCSSISTVIPLKKNVWVKRSENNMKDIIGISIAYVLFISDEKLEIKQGR